MISKFPEKSKNVLSKLNSTLNGKVRIFLVRYASETDAGNVVVYNNVLTGGQLMLRSQPNNISISKDLKPCSGYDFFQLKQT